MDKCNQIKFSILIPAYKEKFLSQAIESCLAQTICDFELIIVDDCSPDNLKSIVSKYDDRRIRYYRNETNCGAVNVVDNWNKCLSYAQGEYVICMGDDDRLLPKCLEEYNHLIQKYPDLDIYHARTELIDERGELVNLQESRPEWESALSALWHQCCCHRIQYIGDFLFRTSSLRREGGFYKLPLAIFSDNISSIRAAKRKGVANTQDVCFQYRINRYTITQNGNPRILVASIKMAYEWFLEFLQEYPYSEIDLKCRKLLLDQNLKRHFYGMMMSVIERDLDNEGISAISYWKMHCEELGFDIKDMEAKLSLFRKSWYISKIRKFIRI